jgi:hypothetical protein
MNAGASGPLAALAGLTTALLTCVATAQEEPRDGAPLGVELHYDGFPGCPRRDAFVRSLEARLRGDGASAVTRLDVQLRPQDGADGGPQRVEGSIVVTDTQGARSTRVIVTPTCQEASDALALIAALALHGMRVEQPTQGSPGEVTQDGGEPATTSRRATADLDRTQGSGKQRGVGRQAPATAEAEVEAQPLARPGSIDGAEPREGTAPNLQLGAVESTPSTPAADAKPQDATASPAQVHAHALLSGGIATGVLAAPHPLFELALGLEHDPPGAALLAAQAGLRLSPDQTPSFDIGAVDLEWRSGFIAPCIGVRSGELAVAGCAVLEFGLLAAGSVAEPQRDERRAWVATGPGLTLTYDPSRLLRLHLRTEALTPLARYTFELPRGHAVHEPATLELRAAAGVGLRLW